MKYHPVVGDRPLRDEWTYTRITPLRCQNDSQKKKERQFLGRGLMHRRRDQCTVEVGRPKVGRELATAAKVNFGWCTWYTRSEVRDKGIYQGT